MKRKFYALIPLVLRRRPVAVLLVLYLVSSVASGIFFAKSEKAPHMEAEAWDKKTGDIIPGDELLVDFDIRNTGTAPLKLFDAKTSCFCTVGKFNSVVAPGKTGSVSMWLDTREFSIGPFTSTLAVHTNDPKRPLAVFQTRGITKLYVQWLPAASAISFTSHRGFKEKKQYVLHSEVSPFTVMGVESSLVYVEAKAERSKADYKLIKNGTRASDQAVARKGDWIVTLTLLPSAPTGATRGFILLKTDLKRRRVIRIPIVITIYKNIPGQSASS